MSKLKMQKLRIIALTEDRKALLERLQRLGTLQPEGGEITLSSFGLAKLPKKIAVTVDGRRVGASVKGGEVVFDSPVTVAKRLRVKFVK